MLIKASELPKASRGVSPEYLAARINSAVERGYNSSLIWLRDTDLPSARKLLDEAGYKYAINKVDEDKASTQLEVSW